MKYGGSVAAVGLAGGASLPATACRSRPCAPVNLLGIDFVMQPYARRLEAWQRLATDLPLDKLESTHRPAALADPPRLARQIAWGRCRAAWLWRWLEDEPSAVPHSRRLLESEVHALDAPHSRGHLRANSLYRRRGTSIE